MEKFNELVNILKGLGVKTCVIMLQENEFNKLHNEWYQCFDENTIYDIVGGEVTKGNGFGVISKGIKIAVAKLD
jgi:hypothetical protein